MAVPILVTGPLRAELNAKYGPPYLECSGGGTPGPHQPLLCPSLLLSKAHRLWERGRNWNQKLTQVPLSSSFPWGSSSTSCCATVMPGFLQLYPRALFGLKKAWMRIPMWVTSQPI